MKWPGLLIEKRGQRTLYRVRAAGDKTIRTTIPVGPDEPSFKEHYLAARKGFKPDKHVPLPESVGWLVGEYIKAMGQMNLHPATVKQRAAFLQWLRSEVGDRAVDMPRDRLIRLQDMKTAGAGDNFVKTVRAMYKWAMDRGMVDHNPAIGIPKRSEGTGAKPWTLDDLSKFKEWHPPGTMPHRALTLFMFTACRIGDAVKLGPANEIQRDGITWLDWQPEKKGSSRVTIPMLPPLYEATRGAAGTYLKNEWGLPYASKAAFGNAFRGWVDDAGLKGLSPHGIRKAAGELLALAGATQYHIMAIHGHSNAKTSEVYTRGVERMILAGQAMDLLRDMRW